MGGWVRPKLVVFTYRLFFLHYCKEIISKFSGSGK